MVRHCDEAVAKSYTTVHQSDPAFRICDGCDADRSLVLLVSDYSKPLYHFIDFSVQRSSASISALRASGLVVGAYRLTLVP